MCNLKRFIIKNKNLLICIGLFLIYFLFLSAFKNSEFFTDEGDNMLGGMTLVRGGHIYNEFPSQHTPFMYYLMSIFSFIGIKGTVPLRLCFYAVLSLIWVFMYKRYNKYVGKIPLIIYPIIYIFTLANYRFGHNVLADHIEAQCLVILLIETILFNKNKKLLKHSELIIGLSIFISVWSAFVSVIPILVIVITLFTIDIKHYIEKNKKFKGYLKSFIKKYYKVLIFTILPFIIALIPIIVNGNLKSFYTQAFYINMKIYPKYNFYSSNIILTSLKTIYNYVNYNLESIKMLRKDITLLVNLVFLVMNVFFIINYKKNNIVTILLIIFILMCGNRGFNNFHAIPYFAVSIISFLLIYKKVDNKKVYYSIILFILLILGFRYFPLTENALKKSIKPNYEKDQKLATNNYIYYYNLETYRYVDSGILPASKYTTMVPWFAELYEEDAIKELEKNKPNVIYYEPSNGVWGYQYQSFAKKMDKYIKENYIFVSKYKFWILKEYKEEAEKILNMKIADYTTSYNKLFVLNPILGDMKIEQTFKAEKEQVDTIEIRFKTFKKINYSLVKFSILDEENIVKEIIISAEDLKNEKYYKFDLSDLNLIKNKIYKIRIESINANDYDKITVYCTKDKDNFDNNHAIINGIDKKYDLDMNIYYKGV
ncbi:MAG: hypothetical protein J6K21_02030 [Bacilli bacterium]|nr:hypothetical protein [Bacilli bacterium]